MGSLLPTLTVLYAPPAVEGMPDDPERMAAVWALHAEVVAAGAGHRLVVTTNPDDPALTGGLREDVEAAADELLLADLTQITGPDARALLVGEGHAPETVDAVMGRMVPSVVVGRDVRLQGTARIFTAAEVEVMREGLRAPDPVP